MNRYIYFVSIVLMWIELTRLPVIEAACCEGIGDVVNCTGTIYHDSFFITYKCQGPDDELQSGEVELCTLCMSSISTNAIIFIATVPSSAILIGIVVCLWCCCKRRRQAAKRSFKGQTSSDQQQYNIQQQQQYQQLLHQQQQQLYYQQVYDPATPPVFTDYTMIIPNSSASGQVYVSIGQSTPTSSPASGYAYTYQNYHTPGGGNHFQSMH
ncbi:hypothetical protein SAMD00019534_013330, partial [Acytostelium subglobosum LB1]|uniref:hypothetical protein n=1 Tax=Acytostelium subglobosum LB1 TaxID=1410327 RepID=UPI000644D2D1